MIAKIGKDVDIGPDSPMLAEHWRIVSDIHDITAVVNAAMLLASYSSIQKLNELSLKVSSITLLAAAAISHRLLALWHPESARKCLESALEIISISSTFTSEEYQYLEPSLVVSGQPFLIIHNLIGKCH